MMRPDPVPTALDYAAIDAYVEREMRRLNVPGVSLAIVEGDRITHMRGFGCARPDCTPPTPQTPFFIGSVTKSITALGVMQLVEQGKIDLDAPVQRYLPWFRVADPGASAQMTVRHLLNQTSGMSMAAGSAMLGEFDEGPGATVRQVRGLATLQLARPVGSKFEYSNANFNVLGLIIEAASGEPYADYVQHSIFDPLQMSHSYTKRAAANRHGLAMGHRFWFWRPVAAPDMKVPAGSLPAGELISCAEDLAHYLIAQLNGGRYRDVQLLSPDGVEELQRGAVDYYEMGAFIAKYAMGWFVSDVAGQKAVWHSGLVPDFTAYVALLPGQMRGIVLLLNAGHFFMEPVGNEFGMGATALLAGEQKPPRLFPWVRYLPWVMRGLLLIPVLQAAGVALTLGLLGRWRREPASRPGPARALGLQVLPSLVLNLALAAVPVALGRSRMAGFFSEFLPDGVWLARISGGFAAVWAVVRTLLVLTGARIPGEDRRDA